jgi:hypothetical protein
MLSRRSGGGTNPCVMEEVVVVLEEDMVETSMAGTDNSRINQETEDHLRRIRDLSIVHLQADLEAQEELADLLLLDLGLEVTFHRH